ncbi:MAG: hypothetical protein M3539_10625 [Acidobacteriota bacterium]|nr:hypothetical protein [Acidobacteriota bacterium]
MRHIAQFTRRYASTVAQIMTVAIFSLVIIALQPITAHAQWTNPDAQGNINNTNTGNVGIGTTAPGSKVTVSSNAAPLPAPTGTGTTIAHFSSADALNPRVLIDSFAAVPALDFRRANTTAASPSGLLLDENMGQISWFGRGSTGYGAGVRASIRSSAAENWSDTAQGTYLSFSTTVKTTAAAVERLRITDAGNVGIGTTDPLTKLQVNHSSANTNLSNLSLADLLAFRNTSNTNGNMTLLSFQDSAGWGNALFGAVQTNQTAHSADLVFLTRNAGASGERMRITGNGNVGIGTSAPAAKLDVNGHIHSLGVCGGGVPNSQGAYLTWNQFCGTGETDFINHRGAGVGGFAFVDTVNGATLNTLMFITGSGNVGIGTTAPSSKLQVAGQIRSTTGGFMFPDGTVQLTASSGGTITGVTAGTGLTGGGTSGATTLDIGAGTGVTVAADTVSVNYGSTAGTAVQGNTTITVSPGNGMSGGGSLTLGAGGTLTLINDDKGSSQNIFKGVANAAGTTQFSAGSNTDAVRFAGSGGTNITFDPTTKKVIIDGPTSTPSAANISAGQFGQNTGGGNYTFPGDVTVTGNINAKYQDVAEWVPATHALPAGTVATLDPTKSNHVEASSKAYDTRVAGVVSAQPGITLGERAENKLLVATTGRVKVKVDASAGAIQVGDLLVTSEVPGLAMKSQPIDIGGVQIHRPGTIIGKALEPLAKGRGEILVLLSLQ